MTENAADCHHPPGHQGEAGPHPGAARRPVGRIIRDRQPLGGRLQHAPKSCTRGHCSARRRGGGRCVRRCGRIIGTRSRHHSAPAQCVQSAPSTKSMEQMLWDAACSIRGEKDAAKFKDYLLPLLFLKRLSDVFDDEIDAARRGIWRPRNRARDRRERPFAAALLPAARSPLGRDQRARDVSSGRSTTRARAQGRRTSAST